MTIGEYIIQFLQVIGFIVVVILMFTGLFYFLTRESKKQETEQPEPKKRLIDKVCIWYDGNDHADVYEDVDEAFVFTNNNLLRIVKKNGDKVYVALNTRGFKRLNVYYEDEPETYTLPKADNLGED
jgi:hypothetical protein